MLGALALRDAMRLGRLHVCERLGRRRLGRLDGRLEDPLRLFVLCESLQATRLEAADAQDIANRRLPRVPTWFPIDTQGRQRLRNDLGAFAHE